MWPTVGVKKLRALARHELRGCGSSELGEWETTTDVAFHLRRRLSTIEQEKVGYVVDLRGTIEAKARLEAMATFLSGGLKWFALDEISNGASREYQVRLFVE